MDRENWMLEAIEALENSKSQKEFLNEVSFLMKDPEGKELLMCATFEEVKILRKGQIIASAKLYTNNSTVDLLSCGASIGHVTRKPQGGAEGQITAWDSSVDCHFYIKIGPANCFSDEALVFSDGSVHVLSSDSFYHGEGDRLVYCTDNL